jgi:polyvinyl alcohol dehydrogenase (cytochrome)
MWERSFYADGGRDLDVGASPVIFSDRGRQVLAVGSVAGTLALLDAKSGSIIWSKMLVAGSAVHGLIATAAFDGHEVYVPSAGTPDGVFAVRVDGGVAWSHPTELPVYSAPAAGSGVIVFGTGAVFGDQTAGSILALATADGRTLWSYDTQGAVRSAPAVAGALVVAADYRGDVLAFRPVG